MLTQIKLSIVLAFILILFPVSSVLGEDIVSTAPLTTLLTISPDAESHRNSEGDIVRLADGRLALVYTRFSGGASDHAAAYLALRTSADEGKSWTTDTVLLENEGGANVMSVSLLPSLKNEVLLFYLRKDQQGTSCSMFVRRSGDDLKTLGDAAQVTTLPGYHVVNNARVVRLASGRIMVPAAYHTDPDSLQTTKTVYSSSAFPTAYYSDDDGVTWQRSRDRVLAVSERRVLQQEPGVVELSDGRILMHTRTDKGSIYAQYSGDQGETWSAPEPTALKSPLSPATIKAVPMSRRLVAVWNDHTGRWPYPTTDTKGGWRSPLCLAISDDDGKTWSPSEILEGDLQGWYCYTSMTFTDNSLLLTYCAGQGRKEGLTRMKAAELPLDWIRALK